MNVISQEQIEFARYESGFMREWTLVKIEGEEPVKVEEAKGPAAKKAPAQAGKPDQKKGAVLEEITDNRPR